MGLLRANAEEPKGYDIVAFTETWLDDSVGEAELSTGLRFPNTRGSDATEEVSARRRRRARRR